MLLLAFKSSRFKFYYSTFCIFNSFICSFIRCSSFTCKDWTKNIFGVPIITNQFNTLTH